MTSALGEKKVHALLWELTIPATLGMLSSAIFNLVDRYFIGRIGPLALSGVGITMPIQVLQMAIVLLVGIGTSILVSIRLGEHKKEEAEQLLWVSFQTNIVLMAVFAILLWIFQDKIWQWLSVSEQVKPFAKPYIMILMIGAVFSMPGYCLSNSLRAIGEAKITMKAILYSSLLNMVLDPFLIFVFDMGISGAAIATVLSQLALTVYIVCYFVRQKSLPIHLKKKRIRNRWELTRQIFQKGSPSFYMQILAAFVGGFVNAHIIRYGSDYDIAAIAIILTVFGFYHTLVFGLVQGNQPIVGYNWGSGQYQRVKEALLLTTLYSFLLSFALFLVVQLFPNVLIGFFAHDIRLVESASKGIRIYLAALPLFGIQVIGAQYFQSVGREKLSAFLLLLRYGLILVPSILLLAPRWGVVGVYWSNVMSDSLSALITIIYMGFEIFRLQKLAEVS